MVWPRFIGGSWGGMDKTFTMRGVHVDSSRKERIPRSLQLPKCTVNARRNASWARPPLKSQERSLVAFPGSYLPPPSHLAPLDGYQYQDEPEHRRECLGSVRRY